MSRQLPPRFFFCFLAWFVLSLSGIFLTGCNSNSSSPSENTPAPSPTPPSIGKSSPPPGMPPPPLTLEEAENRLKRAPESAISQLEYARAVRNTAPAKAAKALRTAIRLDPKLTEAYYLLINLYTQFNYMDRVIETYEERLKNTPDDVNALTALAQWYIQIPFQKRAKELIDAAAKAAPDDIEVQVKRAMMYYTFRESKTSIAIIQEQLQKHPQEHNLFYRLSEFQRASGDYSGAEKSIQQAISLQPDKDIYHNQLAHIYATMEPTPRLQDAEKEAKKALELGDKDADDLYWYAISINTPGREKEALAAFQAVEKIDASYERTAFYLGTLYNKLGQKEEGQKALALYGELESNISKFGQAKHNFFQFPEKVENWKTLANFHVKIGNDGLGIYLLRKASKQFPNDKTLREQLKSFLVQSNRTTEASQIKI